MIVVDSNILAYLYLPGDYTEAAEALLLRQPEWAAPPLWRSEFRNILTGYLRRGMLSFEQAVACRPKPKPCWTDSNSK
jgi:predicted nucleic acid-binding protein